MAKIRYNESCNDDSLLSLLEELDPPQKGQNCWIAASPALETMRPNVLHNDQRESGAAQPFCGGCQDMYYLAADSEICVEFT